VELAGIEDGDPLTSSSINCAIGIPGWRMMFDDPRLIISRVKEPSQPGWTVGEMDQESDPGAAALSLDPGREAGLDILGMVDRKAHELDG
jgi:hypothetical protein